MRDRPPSDSRELFRMYQTSRDVETRDRIFAVHANVGEFYVTRYSGRGVPAEDLRQVAMLSVLRAIDRFDPDRGVEFSTFASRTVEGEFKRHFRDRTWLVRPPRRTQEMHLALRRAEEDLTHRYGRSPTVSELADEVGDTEDHVLEALEARSAHSGVSLDAPFPSGDERSGSTVDHVPSNQDPGYSRVDDRVVLSELLTHLDRRERRIIHMRFFENRTQEEIAERIGVSQSYLSRILRKVLTEMREQIERHPDPIAS